MLGVVVVSLLCSFFPGSQGAYRRVSSAEGQDGAARLQALVSLLQESSIPWREKTDPAGLRSIEVPDGEPYQRALHLLGKDGADSARPTNGDWPYKSGSWIDTPNQFEARLLDYHRQRIEQAILWNKNIEKVTIGLPRSSAQHYVGGERSFGDSAAVVLQLKIGVPMLSRSEAESIRSMVSSAFNLRAQKVSISDNAGHSYPPESTGAVPLDIQAEEDRCRTKIQEVIQGYYRNAFREDEFYVGVMVSLSSQRSSVEREEVDQEKSFSRPTRSEYLREDEKSPKDEASTGGILSPESPHKVVIQEKTEEVPFVTRAKTTIDTPPGQVKAVSVNVLLDLEAVERVLGKEPARRQSTAIETQTGRAAAPSSEREASIKGYEKRQEEALGKLLSPFKLLSPVVDSSVCVMVQPFNRGEARMGPQSFAAVGATAPGTATPTWFSPSWKEISAISALVLVFLCLLTVLMGRLRRGYWAGKAPDLAYALPGRADAPGEWSGINVGDSSRHALYRDRASSGSLQEGILRSVSDISTLVRKRPDVAASVLRFWLSQDGDDGKEDGNNGGGLA